ncbi:hypothetical protein G3480_25295 [Thiorhodococcus mannitoliphagus]|uniref:Ysc84 actin-binding domain-containing protein n=1 Tax=Thiorhodococcus mannitoliphagus TaxID=329406 RepID=A0A6P1E7S9_9GAMM|nr:hypothetical protein [Thiorhodococcus mannitoliphagus]NEX23555.1 hypothetical protein [Thiorhodococcus mannitoliphagus]
MPPLPQTDSLPGHRQATGKGIVPQAAIGLAATLVLTAAVILPASAQDSFLGNVKDRAAKAAEKVAETAGKAAHTLGDVTGKAIDSAQTSLEEAEQDLRDEDTPQETRAKLDAMAETAIQELQEQKPQVTPLIESSAGYAVFDTRQLSYGVSGGYGRGVAVDLSTDARTYMKMGSLGVGLSFGIGGFDTRIIILVKDAFTFNKLITQGLDASAEAGTMIKDDREELALRFDDGRAVFVLTKEGWKVSAKLSGAKYWPDDALN